MSQLIQIAIQARKNSTRLPGKALMHLGSKPIFEHCLENAGRAVGYLEKKFKDRGWEIDLTLLVPQDEAEFWDSVAFPFSARVFPGHPTDVLDRYMKLFDKYKPEFIVRLTADCPNVPFLVINKAVAIAINHRLDYVTNAWDRYRTAPDGHDVEVMSAKCMAWLAKNAKSPSEREHVTTAIRNNPQILSHFRDIGFKASVLLAKEDMSDIKTSIDTEEEYQASALRYYNAQKKLQKALEDRLGVYEY